jgi:predicted RNA binding protein YcfA (HicA-like mRNA interferase family)
MIKLPIVSSREMEKILLKLGFAKVRQKGSHAFFSHKDGRSTVVPFHSGEDLGRGIIHSILNDIEISREDYEKLRLAI